MMPYPVKLVTGLEKGEEQQRGWGREGADGGKRKDPPQPPTDPLMSFSLATFALF